MINKQAFITRYAEKLKCTKKNATIAVETYMEVLKESLKEDGKVAFTGDIAYEIKDVAERIGRNPANGEEIIIPQTKKLSVKIGKLLKDFVKEI